MWICSIKLAYYMQTSCTEGDLTHKERDIREIKQCMYQDTHLPVTVRNDIPASIILVVL